MYEVTERVVDPSAPAGYRLGDPIALQDLLALPPDDRRYTRDPEGRLALMAPDDSQWHTAPLGLAIGWFWRALRPPACVFQEPGIAFPRIWTLKGELLPESRLGPRTLEPDVALFRSLPGHIFDDQARARGFDPAALELIVEVLSPGTHRQDLGLGSADEVDRPRSYLESGAPEYWVLNAHPYPLGGLPSRAGLFLRANDGRWEALEGDDLVHGPERVLGFAPVIAGRLRSKALETTFDVAELWAALLPR